MCVDKPTTLESIARESGVRILFRLNFSLIFTYFYRLKLLDDFSKAFASSRVYKLYIFSLTEILLGYPIYFRDVSSGLAGGGGGGGGFF